MACKLTLANGQGNQLDDACAEGVLAALPSNCTLQYLAVQVGLIAIAGSSGMVVY